MLRRITILLVVCFGLLSIVAPALTCAAAASQGDCCPDGQPSPCDRAENAACCNATPISNGRALATASHVRLEIQVPSTPQPAEPAAWACRVRLTGLTHAAQTPPLISYRENDSSTYLRTARLRI
jgi:hypothetical protein